MPASIRIWILENDASYQGRYHSILGGYHVDTFATIEAFYQRWQNKSPDDSPHLVISEINLPDGDFLSLTKRLTENTLPQLGCPFVVVSSVDDVAQVSKVFELGAEDYISKPFLNAELIVKVDRIFQRESPLSKSTTDRRFGIDSEGLRVFRDGRYSMPLTAKEFQIISLLAHSYDFMVDRDKIMSRLWNDTAVGVKTLDVHLFNLRKKLSELGLNVVHVAPSSFKLTVEAAVQNLRSYA